MNIAYFDCFSGVSGDMALGALIDLGVPAEALIFTMKQLKSLKDWSIETRRERRGSITGVRVVISAGEQPHRSFSDIKALFNESGLEPGVREKSLAIFERLQLPKGGFTESRRMTCIFMKRARPIPSWTLQASYSAWIT